MIKKKSNFLGHKDVNKLYPIAIIGSEDATYKNVKEAFSNPIIKNKVLNSFTDFVVLASEGKCYSPNKGVPETVSKCITEYPKVIVEPDFYDEEVYKKMYMELWEIGELKLPFPMITIISGELTNHDVYGDVSDAEGVIQTGEVNLLYTCFLTQTDDGVLVHMLFGKPGQTGTGKGYHIVTAHLGIDDKAITLKHDVDENNFGDEAIVEAITNVAIVAMYKLTISGGDMLIHVPTPQEVAVNRKRMNKNKKPLIEFKLITIDGKKRELPSVPHGTHASPRQHWRRGHWRIMSKSGKRVWVNPMLVGDEANGKIIKDYAVGNYEERSHVHH